MLESSTVARYCSTDMVHPTARASIGPPPPRSGIGERGVGSRASPRGHMQSLSLRENWVGLESNPEVLTEYAHKMGVSKYARPTSPADNRLRCTHSPRGHV